MNHVGLLVLVVELILINVLLVILLLIVFYPIRNVCASHLLIKKMVYVNFVVMQFQIVIHVKILIFVQDAIMDLLYNKISKVV